MRSKDINPLRRKGIKNPSASFLRTEDASTGNSEGLVNGMVLAFYASNFRVLTSD